MDVDGNTMHGVIRMKKSDEELKLEIAKELGLLSRIQEGGWKSLSLRFSFLGNRTHRRSSFQETKI